MDNLEVEDNNGSDQFNNTDRNLVDYWYPITYSENIKKDQAYGISIFGEPIVLFRAANGKLQCLQDRCAHRSVPLSIGLVENGSIECRYHGWRFGEGGKCLRVPSFAPEQNIPDYFKVPSHPVEERHGKVWVWPGNPDNVKTDDSEFPCAPQYNQSGTATYQTEWDIPVSFDLLMENSMDPAHIQFAHEQFQGKSVGPRTLNIPSLSVPTKTEKSKETIVCTYERKDSKGKRECIKIYFTKPGYSYLVVESVDLALEIHLLPIGPRSTRLLFRFVRKFATYLPNAIFGRGSKGIIDQDIAVLIAEQLRLDQGSPAWNIPVKGDALPLYFRRWWDKAVERHAVWFGKFESTLKNPNMRRVKVPDIEDLVNINPCIPCEITSQPTTINLIQKKLPELYPQQYTSTRQTIQKYLIGAAIVAAGAYYYKYNFAN